jgi:AraC-like DNA-binding protein
MRPLMHCTRPAAAPHGDYSAYCQGCRCPQAREDWRIYQKRNREGRAPQRRIDATGTRRRIQALAALGHSLNALSDHLGHSRDYLRTISARTTVEAHTEQLVRDLYDQWSMRAGTCTRTRLHAARLGWPPPLAWDDDTIDDPAAQPEGIWFHRNRVRPGHGTEAGARAHHRAGERPCDDCRHAANRAKVDRRARRAS